MAVKSNFTNWCCQNLSKRALNALTVQASTTELGKLFQIFTMRAEKNAFVSHNETPTWKRGGNCVITRGPVRGLRKPAMINVRKPIERLQHLSCRRRETEMETR